MISGKEKGFLAVAGFLLMGGSAFFLWAAAAHPGFGAQAPAAGTVEAVRTFAERASGDEAWMRLHAAILAGPVLWALGSTGVRTLLRDSGGRSYGVLASTALSVGAGLWAVAFIVDGFVAPVQAEAVRRGAEAESALATFRAVQELVTRLGLLSWLLVGVGVLGIAVGLVAGRRGSVRSRSVLAGSGALVGLWPLAAWLGGLFLPGPFGSPTWVPTVMLTAAWFLVLGSYLVGRALTPETNRA